MSRGPACRGIHADSDVAEVTIGSRFRQIDVRNPGVPARSGGRERHDPVRQIRGLRRHPASIVLINRQN
jgi:hypothetical protein